LLIWFHSDFNFLNNKKERRLNESPLQQDLWSDHTALTSELTTFRWRCLFPDKVHWINSCSPIQLI
jgi:hypothetical protein